MSQNESFIDEVSDELRRDRLFAQFRRWAWLGVLIVLVIVGGAAWNEWRKARAAAEAQALGNAIVEALGEPDPAARAAALGEIEADAGAQALVDMLAAAEVAAAADAGDAAEVLGPEATGEDTQARWGDLAAFKRTLLDAADLPPEERISQLEPLTGPGSPYRLLAVEQMAYARAEMGETDAALGLLRDVLADGDVTEGLRRRASQMIVALGGSLDPA